MILYSLRCPDGHQFDAWFRNGPTYDAQAAAGEVACPVCGQCKVAKAPMAPRIGKRSRDAATPDTVESAPETPAAAATPAAAQISEKEIRRALAALRDHVESNCDYVGERFPEEARRIHYKEAAPRPIYGEASPAEAEALQEEGVTLRRIPWLPRTDS